MSHQLERFRIFWKTARVLSMSRAAEELCLTRSAVSHAINKLEAAFGLVLFVRESRRLRLTDDGRRLLEKIEGPLAELEETEDALRLRASHEERPLRFATTHTFLKFVLLPHLAEIQQCVSASSITFFTGSINEAVAEVEEGRADFGLVAVSEARLSAGLFECVPVCRLQEVFAVPTGTALPEKLSPAAVSMLSLITLPHDSDSFSRYRSYFSENGAEIAPRIEVRQMDVIADLVRKGAGVGILYRELLQEDCAQGLCELPVFPAIPPIELMLIRRKDHAGADDAALFRRMEFINW